MANGRFSNHYDVIVVGGGHAGCEAAAASARRGARTALVTLDPDNIGAMSCNPAIGGLGKGHLVREVDALDGLMARAADAAAIHHRMLNASKGTAVQGPRVQADRRRYRAAMQRLVAGQHDLDVVIGHVDALIVEGGIAVGLAFADGTVLRCASVVMTTGTFLGGRLFRGKDRDEGGRIGEGAAGRLAQQLRALALPMGRLKTGTPPRLDGRTIHWAMLDEQPSDDGTWTMAMDGGTRQLPQIFCGVTRTNGATHDVIRSGMTRSPLHSGAIQGPGPRYCPSIEDKVCRFGDRDGHQIFLEPEGLDDHLVYPNGISTSLPVDVQEAMIRSIAGLEQAKIVTPGYAVEYDHVDPRALDSLLMLRAMPGLFCAGQINGTTGYEEAAAQGLVAGANAAARAIDATPLLFDRATSYIGVMIDDLVLQGVSEPYRMLTARAEYRLRLRAENAESRLTGKGVSAGLVGRSRQRDFSAREKSRQAGRNLLDRVYGSAAMAAVGADIRDDGARRTLAEWCRFPEVDDAMLMALEPELEGIARSVLLELMEDGRYAPYVARQDAEIRAMTANATIPLPADIDFAVIGGLSTEMIERLNAARPVDLAAAGRVRGITPAALAAILVTVQRQRERAAA